MARKTPAEYHAQLRAIAAERGGRLLSPTYRGDLETLSFCCAESHMFEQLPKDTKRGRWCPACGVERGSARRRANSLQRLLRIVGERGGRLVTPDFVGCQVKLRFRCSEGHEWEAVPLSVLQGTWCGQCVHELRRRRNPPRRRSAHPWAVGLGRLEAERFAADGQRILERVARSAGEQGGRLLSTEYVHAHSPLEFSCASGHVWRARVDSIDGGSWCQECRKDAGLARLRELARGQGGECLATEYVDMKTRVRWRCVQGHEWVVPGFTIKVGHWCRRCNSRVSGSLEILRRMARERGGECLAEEYRGARGRVRWGCDEGHTWTAEPASILQGGWCAICRLRRRASNVRLNIDVMREVAVERGGECLSKTYVDSKTPVRWQCRRGHRWKAQPSAVRRGTWCPKCSATVTGTLDGMRAMAIRLGGRCLTRSWLNHRDPLLFECEQGHRFKLVANVAKTGVWCQKCPERGEGKAGAARRARSLRPAARRAIAAARDLQRHKTVARP